MARLPRLDVPGLPHLLMQRAHNLGRCVADDIDAQVWQAALQQACRDQGVALHGWALWPQGFLLLLTPSRAGALGLLMQSLGRRYAAHFNRRHGRSGGLWDGRFRVTVLEPPVHVLDALQLLVGADGHRAIALGREASAGPAAPPTWSSAEHALGRRRDPLVQDAPAWWTLGNTPFERESAWARRLDAGLPEARARHIAEAVDKGWVVGSPAFTDEVARLARRPTRPRPRGRPRRDAAAAAVGVPLDRRA
jgi:putative transposase